MNERRRYVVAVLGATGAVGRELIEGLDAHRFPTQEVRALTTEDSAGTEVPCGNRQLMCQALVEEQLEGVDVVLSALPYESSVRWLPKATAAGATVIDCSGWASGRADTPLVVPDVNPEVLATPHGVIASPSATSVAVSRALWPLIKAKGAFDSVHITAMVPASHAGHRALHELHQQATALLNFKPVDVERLPARLAFNCVPEAGALDADGASAHELRVEAEVSRLLQARVSCQATLVPVFVGSSIFVEARGSKAWDRDAVTAAFDGVYGVSLRSSGYPTTMDINDQDEVAIGRVRVTDSGLSLWLTVDNLRVGAAGNMIRVAKLLDLAWSVTQA